MSATKANINWTSVAFGSTSITRITNASVGQGGQLIKFKGDTDQYPTIIACVDQEPHVSITTADVGGVMANLVPGASGSLTLTLNDAKGAGGGAVVFTMNPAVYENADGQAQHAQFGSVTATFQGYSTDGSTPPLTYNRV